MSWAETKAVLNRLASAETNGRGQAGHQQVGPRELDGTGATHCPSWRSEWRASRRSVPRRSRPQRPCTPTSGPSRRSAREPFPA